MKMSYCYYENDQYIQHYGLVIDIVIKTINNLVSECVVYRVSQILSKHQNCYQFRPTCILYQRIWLVQTNMILYDSAFIIISLSYAMKVLQN
jgi:hypothetical protein